MQASSQHKHEINIETLDPVKVFDYKNTCSTP